MDYDKWVSLGERLGLKDGELRDYVQKKESEYLDREERNIRREEDKRRFEAERKAKEAEREVERLEKEAEREEERRRFEAERIEKEAEREEKKRLFQAEVEMKMKEQEIELMKLKIEAGDRLDTPPSTDLRPRLPKFEESKDDIDAYIERFERFSISQGWKEDTWAISLSSLLTGKGLEVYTSMPPEQASDYQELKTAVLKRYQLTEDGFRTKFRESKPEQGETVNQFMARLDRYFSRWTEMADAADTIDKLKDLIIREQFVKVCSTELALFLSIVEMSSLWLDNT